MSNLRKKFRSDACMNAMQGNAGIGRIQVYSRVWLHCGERQRMPMQHNAIMALRRFVNRALHYLV